MDNSTTTVPAARTANITVRAAGLYDLLVTEAGVDADRAQAVIDGLVEATARESATPRDGRIPALYVNRSGGSVMRVIRVNESYVYLEKIDGTGRWAMPRAEYEDKFVKLYRPATIDDLDSMTPDDFELPANAPDDWR